jgi:2-iminoacetate synthase
MCSNNEEIMMIINNNKIEELMGRTFDTKNIDSILSKSKSLQNLSLEEVVVLLSIDDDENLQKIFQAASDVKEKIYGKRLVIFAPLYISNLCNNDCAYCGFRVSNKGVKRRVLTQDEIRNETEQLLRTGQKRVLLVAGEAYGKNQGLDYILESIKTVYSASDGKNTIRRLNVNIAPLTVPEFKRLKETDIGTYQLFQETYHQPTYKKLHLAGPKADYMRRLGTIDNAFKAGIDDVGIGILFGLYDYRYELLALISHIEYLEKEYGMGPHTISVPRLEPAFGAPITEQPPYPLSENDFKKVIAILRLAVPYTGLIMSTRENAEMRKKSFDLGISQISAGSKTNPGGYSEKESIEQFKLGDDRPLDELIYDICQSGYVPSFCTSCYRLGRTGLDFMEYAKPGDIKKKCLPNALLTFQEYLEDYGSDKTKAIGQKLIQKELAKMEDKEKYVTLLNSIKNKKRDIYV